MWAAPPTSSTHASTLSTATTTTVNVRLPPQRCRVSFAFSAKSRWPENGCHDTDVKAERRQNNVGVVGQADGLTAFKTKMKGGGERASSSSSPGVRVKGPSSNKKQGNQQDSKKGGGEERRQLSGSDVLWALQRASAEKAKKYQQQQKRYNANQRDDEMRRAVEVDGGHSNKASTTNAGPHWLRIQSDWGARLEDLEKRLEEFMLMDA